MRSQEKSKHEEEEHKKRKPLFGADMRVGLMLGLVLGIYGVLRAWSGGATTSVASVDPPKIVAAADKPRKPVEKPPESPPKAVAAHNASARSEALTDVLPKGFKNPSKPAEVAAAQTKEPPKESTESVTEAASAKLAAVDSVAPDVTKKAADDAPILLADLPAKSKAKEAANGERKPDAGPLHPYFQRYLDRKEYYVRSGDTLPLIARRLYRDESKVADLLAANKHLVQKADDVRPGMLLRLP
jgi:nucleoid-associated protein YgaU